MAAGQGFKTFTTGEVLSAADVNGYLMQGVLVFANSAERDSEITSPQEGQFAYLKDTNVTTYYTGSAWANLDTTGMTNPMTTTGDTIYSSSGSTPARLPIGTTGQVLTVAGGLPTWASAGGATKNYSQIASTSLSGGSTQVTGLSTYDDIWIFIANASGTTATPTSFFRVNGLSTSIYSSFGQYGYNNTSPYTYKMNPWADASPNDKIWAAGTTTAADTISGYIHLFGCATTGKKMFTLSFGVTSGQYSEYWNTGGFVDTTTSVSSVEFALNGGTFDSGTIKVMAAV